MWHHPPVLRIIVNTMRKDRVLGPAYGVILLASITFAAVYFTTELVAYNDSYFYSLVGQVDRAIEEAYGAAVVTEGAAQPR